MMCESIILLLCGLCESVICWLCGLCESIILLVVWSVWGHHFPLGICFFVCYIQWQCISIMKPTLCTFHSMYWESGVPMCFEHYLLTLRRRYQTALGIFRAYNVSWLWHDRSFTAIVAQPTDIIRTHYTKCSLCSASWGWASNARNT
jgi:hypothetical protein